MSALGSNNYFKKIMHIEESPYRVCLQCGKTSILGQKLLLPGLLGNMLYNLDIQVPQKNNCLTRYGGAVFQISLLLLDILG